MKVTAALKRFQIQKILNDLTTAGWALTIVVMVSLVALLSAEALFWLSPLVRYGTWWVGFITLILALIGGGGDPGPGKKRSDYQIQTGIVCGGSWQSSFPAKR